MSRNFTRPINFKEIFNLFSRATSKNYKLKISSEKINTNKIFLSEPNNKEIFLIFALIVCFPAVIKAHTQAQIHVHTPNTNGGLTALNSGIWQNRSLEVCWENPAPSNASGRIWVKEAVISTWEQQSGLSFNGWGKCSDRSNGIRIKIADEHPHVKLIGKHLNGLKNGMVLNFTFQNFNCRRSKKECIKIIAVHEFGHAVGITHEHNRDDAPICSKEPQGTNGDYKVTSYDLDSVMNYCNPRWSGDGQLSSKDISGIQELYGRPSKLREGFYEIKAKHSNQCLDVRRSSQSNDAKIIQYPCKNTTNQHWKIRKTVLGMFEIQAKHSGKCLSVPRNSTNNWVKVKQTNCNYTDLNQMWVLNPVRKIPGSYKIRPVHSGKCLDIAWGSATASADAIQYRCWDRVPENQAWELLWKYD